MDHSHSSYSVSLPRCRSQGAGGGGSGGVKIGGLWKRSQGISRFTVKPNYKHRVFILTEQALSYYSGTVDVSLEVTLHAEYSVMNNIMGRLKPLKRVNQKTNASILNSLYKLYNIDSVHRELAS